MLPLHASHAASRQTTQPHLPASPRRQPLRPTDFSAPAPLSNLHTATAIDLSCPRLRPGPAPPLLSTLHTATSIDLSCPRLLPPRPCPRPPSQHPKMRCRRGGALSGGVPGRLGQVPPAVLADVQVGPHSHGKNFTPPIRLGPPFCGCSAALCRRQRSALGAGAGANAFLPHSPPAAARWCMPCSLCPPGFLALCLQSYLAPSPPRPAACRESIEDPNGFWRKVCAPGF